MIAERIERIGDWAYHAILSVPVRVKIAGIILLPVIILGLSLNYWVTISLSDWLSYILTDVRVEAAMRAGGRSVILVTLLAAAGSLILASALSFLLTRPLLALREMAQSVAAGDLEKRAPVWSNDEIGDLAIAINQMTDHLVTSQSELARTNRRLAAINQVILAADRETEIHDVLYAILKNTLDVMGLSVGWIYLHDLEREKFHLASWHNVPSELEAHLLNQPESGECSCQEDLLDGRLFNNVQKRECRRLANCYQLNLKTSHITIPIEARDQKFGVVNLLCEENKQLSEDDLDILSAIGAQVSEIVANAWLRLKLAEKEMARQALLESLVEAQEEERSRLARELHDGAGQMLTSLLVRLKMLEKQADTPAVKEGLETVLDATSETIEQVRELSHSLRPAVLEEFGLPMALETLLTETAVKTGLTAHYDLNLEKGLLSPGVEVTLYRIAQESVTNTLRHAEAQNITVSLARNGRWVTMEIEDDGVGFSPQSVPVEPGARHLGLISMHERANIVGGDLDVYSAPGKGTRIFVRVPLPILEEVI